MTAAWITIAALAVSTALLRAAGPVLLGGRELPGPLRQVVALIAPALLAALVVVQTFGTAGGSGIVADERIGGVAAAAAVITYRRDQLLLAGLIAAAVTAGLRAL